MTGGMVSAVRDEASIEEEVMLATGCMVCLSVCNSYCCLVHLSVEQCICVADCLIYTIIRDSILLRICCRTWIRFVKY